MITLATGVVMGVALYIALIFALYGFHQLALLDGNDAYPDWYAPGDLLLRSMNSVTPGVLAGWQCRASPVTAGALAGALGGIAESVFFGAMIGVPLAEFGGRIFLAAFSTAIVSGLTNAVGGVAGAAMRRKSADSSLSSDAKPRLK
jgi:hypothetical protein